MKSKNDNGPYEIHIKRGHLTIRYTGGFSDNYSYSERLYQVRWSYVENVMAILNRDYRIGGIVFYYKIADKACDVHQSVNER